MRSKIGGFCYAIIVFAMLTACSKKAVEVSAIRGSSEGRYWATTSQNSYFFSTDKELNKNVETLNQVLLTQRKSLERDLRKEAVELFDDLEKEGLQLPTWKYELRVTDTVYQANKKYISCLMKASLYTGGAHYNQTYYAYNYDVEKKTFLFPKAIVDYNQTEKINNLLLENFENSENKFDKIPTLKNVTVINFTPKNLIFTYAEYVLGCYAAGPCSISISRCDIEDCLLLKK